MQAPRTLTLILSITCCMAAQANPPAAKDTQSLSISGTVLRADTHAPLPRVEISLNGGGMTGGDGTDFVFRSGGEDASDAAPKPGVITDEKGHFTIANLKPGTYMLRASRTGMVQKNGGEFGTIVRLQAPDSQNVTILMLVSGAISGRVLNEDGEPMQNVSMGAMRYIYALGRRHLFPAANATTDDKGEYRLFGLKPGSYYVMAAAGKEGLESADATDANAPQVTPQAQKKPDVTVYAARFFPNETSPDRATLVTVKAGDEARADFSLSRVAAHKISGKVTGLSPSTQNDSGQHIRYVMAMQRGMEMQSSMGSLRADGTFDIPALPPGAYKLMAIDTDMKGQATYGFTNVAVDSSDVAGVSIALDGAKAQVRGTVRPDSDAKLDLSKLYVTFVSAQPQTSSEDSSQMPDLEFGSGAGGVAKVEPDGSFKADVSTQPAPVYALLGVRSSGFEDWYTSKVLLNGKDVTDSGFRLTDAQRGALEIVISSSGGTVQGTAMDSNKKPFPNAQIVAIPSDPKLRMRLDLLQRTSADGQGHFKLRGVRPGDYMLMALEDMQQQPFAEGGFLKQNAGKIQVIKVGQSTAQIQLQTINAEE